VTDDTCPFAGADGLDFLLESVIARQFYHRAKGEFDAAVIWSNYERALENGTLTAYEFDFSKEDRLALMGGWTHTRDAP
jgi:hypothetical protein